MIPRNYNRPTLGMNAEKRVAQWQEANSQNWEKPRARSSITFAEAIKSVIDSFAAFGTTVEKATKNLVGCVSSWLKMPTAQFTLSNFQDMQQEYNIRMSVCEQVARHRLTIGVSPRKYVRVKAMVELTTPVCAYVRVYCLPFWKCWFPRFQYERRGEM